VHPEARHVSQIPAPPEQLRRAVEQLIGEECWSATVSEGSILLLSFGPQVPRARPLRNLFLTELERTHESERQVHIWCAWRLDSASEVLSSWRDPKPGQCPTPPDLECLRGARVTGASLSEPAWDLTLHFGVVGSLKVFCDQSVLEPEGDNYSVRTPLGTFTVAPGGDVSET
jgi:hypothetical protein